jgi:hypothetical protein
MKRRNINPHKATKMFVKMRHKSHPLHFVHGTQLLKEGFRLLALMWRRVKQVSKSFD